MANVHGEVWMSLGVSECLVLRRKREEKGKPFEGFIPVGVLEHCGRGK
jgi:hypothetical protein